LPIWTVGGRGRQAVRIGAIRGKGRPANAGAIGEREAVLIRPGSSVREDNIK
jgi:hypothetical protein